MTWGSLATRVLTHPHISGTTKSAKIGAKKSPVPPSNIHHQFGWKDGIDGLEPAEHKPAVFFNGSRMGHRWSIQHKAQTNHEWRLLIYCRVLMGFSNLELMSKWFTICQFSKTAWLYHSGWWLSPTPLKNDGVSSSLGMIFHSQDLWKVIIQSCSKPTSILISISYS